MSKSAERATRREGSKSKKDKSKTKAAPDATVNEEPAAETKVEKSATKKRKRETLPEEIEVDVSLPEPLSKKDLRRAKKGKVIHKPSAEGDTSDGGNDFEGAAGKQNTTAEKKEAQRSEFGVWIGNLPWSATKDSLRTFLTSNSDIVADQITRVHMPAPTKPPNPNWTTKPLNKGFAYVDFATQLAMYSAIALTETKMDGRPLLIKNAKSFEGRPEKPKEELETKDGKPPNKRVFVGNLGFDVTKDDLYAHYGQCGEVEDIHMATFEDSGKCKGYAWVTFVELDAAKSAVRGFIFKDDTSKDKEKDESEERQAKGKKRKWMINKFFGRDLRCEFAEDATVRYNKRFKKADIEGVHPDRQAQFDSGEGREERASRPKKQPRGKVDPRTIKSGAAHTSAPRASQAIVEPQGKKITFD